MRTIRTRFIFMLICCGAAPALLTAQATPVTFQVDMRNQIALNRFNPATEFVDIAGTFNNWGDPATPLSDENGDQIYEITISGFADLQVIEFKFRYNGKWDGREEFPGAGNNRSYTVRTGENIIYVWYNDNPILSGPPEAHFGGSPQLLFEGGTVQFQDRSSGAIENWKWTFEGGVPATSTAQHPSIRFDQTGSYDVELIVSNQQSSDTLRRTDFIEVQKRDFSDTKWWNNTVFYEIFVRSFYDSDGDGIGDFRGIIEKLDYLNDGDPATDSDLGITGIWLMPIHASPSYHGYDVIDYRSINPDYGTMADFKDFLQQAHNRGIKVIIDFVMNHSSDQHNWFQKSAQGDPAFRDFYRWTGTNPGYNGPWGQQVWHNRNGSFYYGLFWGGMPDINYNSAAVKDSMFAVSDFWLKDIGIDGFRLDAVKFIFEDGSKLEDTETTFQFWADFTARVKQAKSDAFSVGEAWTNTQKIVNYVKNDRLDFCFDFDLSSAMLEAVNSGSTTNLAAQIREVYDSYPFLQFGTFLTNHDQNRVMEVLQRQTEKVKVAASLYLTLPGIPFIYYGEEIGMLGVKPDEHIRRPMQWNDGPNGGFTSGTPWEPLNTNYSSFNVQKDQANQASLLNWYKKLIAIRNQSTALRQGEYREAANTSPSVLSFIRIWNGEAVLVVVNVGATGSVTPTLSLPGGILEPGPYTFKNLLNGDDSTSVTVNGAFELDGITIQKRETKIYRISSAETGENSAPVVARTLPDTTIVFAGSWSHDLKADSPVFTDPDGDALTYSAVGSVDSVATIQIQGSLLILTPGKAGETTVTVTATDAKGLSVATAFKAKVVQPTGTRTTESTLPKAYRLAQNYPNPFNPTTTISFDLPKASRVSLQIFSLSGRLVKTLFEGMLTAGSHAYTWNARALSSTIYLYRLQADGFTNTRKLVYIK